MAKYDLTSQQIRDSLAPRRAPYWYELGPGRHVGVLCKGNTKAIWKARYRARNGLYHETSLGPMESARYPGLTFEGAVREAEQWFASTSISAKAISRHIVRYNGQLIYCPIGPVYTVGHALRDYLEWKRLAAAPTTFYSVLTMINHHLAGRVASVPLADFNGRHFHQLCVDVLETPPKYGNRAIGARRDISDLDPEALRKRKKTMNALTSTLRGAFALAWDNGEIDTDRPQRCLRHLPNVDRPRMVFLRREECKRLIEAARPDLRELILGALYTGCRVRELVYLKVADVGREGFGIYVSPSKNYRPRFVLLPEEGMAFFLSLCRKRQGHEYVFRNQDGRPWSERYKHLFRDLTDACGLPKSTVFHSLRHTYASQLVQAGMQLSIVAKQLGHADIATVDRTYGHLAPQLSEAEVQRRFSPLRSEYIEMAAVMKPALDGMRERFGNGDWRAYAEVNHDTSWPRSNFSKFRGELLSQLPR
uniref:Phage integrase n=1 Tax=Chelativorans sp. (strain BNC1) TaxID=266779 RepID=Q11J21_CHESB